eukprot:s2413_g15.t1
MPEGEHLPGSSCADPLRARGWASVNTMQAHIDAHLAGSLQGEVPAAWLQARGRQRCQVCGLSVSTRHGIHPTCRPQARASAGPDHAAPRDGSATLPSIAEIQAGRTPTLRHVPAAARSLWCKVLTKTLAAVVHYLKHAKAAAAFTVDRLRRWEDGERSLLWESRGHAPSGHHSLTVPQRRDLATSLAREGFEGKACAALLADGLAPDTPETVAALRALHRVQPDPVAPPVHELPPALSWCLMLWQEPCGASPQPRLLDHPALGSSTSEKLAGLAGVMLSWFNLQAAVHCVRAWCERHAGATNKVLVKLDFQNAFNTVSRQEVLSATCTYFPTLARWVKWCYGSCTTLQFGGAALQSAAGVQQGDPLGPLLFAAALQPVAAELRDGPLDLSLFYLDDGVVAGDVAAVGAAIAHVQQRAAAIGLSLNLSKCEVVVPGPATAANLSAALPAPLLWGDGGADRVLRQFEFLGAAIGDDAFVALHTAQRVTKTAALLDAIAELDDPQVALRLLRACAGHTRLLHSMRCNPPLAQQDALAHFDSLVRDCFSSFTGGLAQAGLNLRSTHLDASAAYLASVGGSAARCLSLDSHFGVASSLHPFGCLRGLPGFCWWFCCAVFVFGFSLWRCLFIACCARCFSSLQQRGGCPP